MNRWLMVAAVAWVSACSSDEPKVSQPSADSSTSSPTSTPNTSASSNSTTSGPTAIPTSGVNPGVNPPVQVAPSPTSGMTTATSSTSSPNASEPDTSGSSTEPNPTSSEPVSTTTTEGSTSETPGETVPERCSGGPLSEPVAGCKPVFEETGDYYADCVDRINQFRWECQCLPPLARHEAGEDCADAHSQYDFEQGRAHAGFRANICTPGGSAQNECPGYGGRFGIVDFCLQQMWDEGPGEDFQAHGHYINMSSTDFSRVACGIYTTPEGEIWAVQNFFR